MKNKIFTAIFLFTLAIVFAAPVSRQRARQTMIISREKCIRSHQNPSRSISVIQSPSCTIQRPRHISRSVLIWTSSKNPKREH